MFTINSSNFNVSGSTLYVVFKTSSNVEYPSCNYTIEKDQIPTFEISPTSASISCGSTSPKTFTVNNVYNSPGTLSYSWNVGSGWKRDGSPVSGTITTTTNSITLAPNSTTVLPSSVSVTTTLDGNTYPTSTLTATVSRGNYNPSYPISGNSKLCSTAIYSVNSLPTGTSVTSWSVSNTSVASITGSGNTATLTATANGVISISAILTNACGQTATITKNSINVGKPTFLGGNISGEHNPVVGEQKYYSAPSATGATSYYWYFDVGNNQTGTNIDGWKILNGQGTTGVTIKVGNPGLTVIVCRATNSCGNSIKYKYVTPRTLSDPCDDLGAISFSSNPMNAGNLTNKVIYPIDPCDGPIYVNKQLNTKNSKQKTEFKSNAKISIFNVHGELVSSGNQETKKLDVSHLKKGLYIVRYQTEKGKVITKKLMIN